MSKKKLLFFFLFSISTTSAFNVRVLLNEKNSNDLSWSIKSNAGFILSDYENPEFQEIIESSLLIIKAKKNMLHVNNRRLARNCIKIVPREGKLEFEDNSYSGSLVLIKINDVVYLVNHVELEEYVFSVTRWESWPGWPLEVNKAFAIACRSYVTAKIFAARSNEKNVPLFDIKCTNIHQTYRGSHEFDVIRQAIEETRGIVMTYDKKPILAMYDCCCGGIIPSKIKGMNFEQAPYLARDYACIYCKECKLFNWKITYDIHTFEKLLEKELGKKIVIKEIKVSKKDEAGLTQETEIKTPQAWLTITGKKIYSLCKEVKSFCFSIIKNKNTIQVSGRGYGHHLGICQWGARTMVKQKACTYKDVLYYYYPRISFMKIES